MTRLAAAALALVLGAGDLPAQMAVPAAPRAPRPPRAWSGHRFSSVYMSAHGGQPLDSARVSAFLTTLSQTPVSICEMAVDNLGNGWGWADGSTGVRALRDQSPTARLDREDYGQAEIAENAVPVLATSLGRADACSRRAAARLLGQSDLPSASRALRDAAKHSDGKTREAALLGIGIKEDSLNYPAAVQGLEDRDPEVVRMAAWAVGEYERAASVPLLLPLLKRSEVGVRLAAVVALGNIEDTRATKPLLPLLQDKDIRIRIATADALGSLEDAEAVPALAGLLKDESREVRLAVVSALGTIESESVTSHLVIAMKDRDAEVRRAAAEALGNR